MPTALHTSLGHSHDDGKAGTVSRAGKPLVPVDDVILPVFDRAGLHPGRIRSRSLGLGHGKAAANPSLQQGLQKSTLLFGGPVFDQDLHVPGVRCLAIESIMTEVAATQDSAHQSVLHQAEAHAAVLSGNLGTPVAQLSYPLSNLSESG